MKTQNENEFNNTASRQKGRIILFGILTLAIMVFIFVQSAMPDVVSAEESNLIVEIIRSIMEKASVSVSNQEMLSFLVRKCAHFTEYAVFGASLAALGREIGPKVALLPAICWLFGMFYAVTDEIHQLFVPGRFGQFTDVVIDSMGGHRYSFLHYNKKSYNKKSCKKGGFQRKITRFWIFGDFSKDRCLKTSVFVENFSEKKCCAG